MVYLRNDSNLNKKEENKKKISPNSLLVYSVFESVFEELFTLQFRCEESSLHSYKDDKNNDSGNNNVDNIKKIKMVETHIYGHPNGRMSREN